MSGGVDTALARFRVGDTAVAVLLPSRYVFVTVLAVSHDCVDVQYYGKSRRFRAVVEEDGSMSALRYVALMGVVLLHSSEFKIPGIEKVNMRGRV